MIFISTTCFDFDFLKTPNIAVKNGLCNIELSGGGKYYDSDYLNQLLDIFLENKNSNIRIHNYFPIPEESFIMNFASEVEEIIQKSFNHVELSLSLCSKYNIPYYSLHPGYLAQSGTPSSKGYFEFEQNSFINYDTGLKLFLKNFATLNELAKKYRVKLAIENLFPKFGKIDSLNNTFEDFEAILAEIPNDVGLLIDFGHLNVSATALNFDRIEYLEKIIQNYGDRIFEVHISGNDGSDDQHLPLEENDWQFEAIRMVNNLPGATGDGVSMTLEVRKIDIELIKIIKNKINHITTGGQ